MSTPSATNAFTPTLNRSMPPPMTAFGTGINSITCSSQIAPPPTDSNSISSGPVPTHISRRGMTAAELYSNRLKAVKVKSYIAVSSSPVTPSPVAEQVYAPAPIYQEPVRVYPLSNL